MRTLAFIILLLSIALPAQAQKKKKKRPPKVIVLEEFCNLRPPIPRPTVIFITARSHTPEQPAADDALYLRALSLAEADNLEASAAAFEALIRQHPTSRHVTEAHFRAGDAHFGAHALDKAARAFTQAARDPAHPLHDDALYMLAWTRFRQDKLTGSVAAFVRLLNVYDADSKRPEDLRDEAIAFMAAILVEEDWDMDGVRDKITPIQRAQTLLRGLSTDLDRMDALDTVKKLDREYNGGP